MTGTNTANSGSASLQATLWGRAARDYAELAEGLSRDLFEDAFRQLELGPGVRLLDVGCGSGVAAAMAAERGAQVSGLDATPEFVALARERVPDGDFREGELEQLPYPNDSFDVVTGFNSFQYAANPTNALAEARRVTRPGGSAVIATWGRPERANASAFLKALSTLMPPPPPGAPGPFALSEEGALAALVSAVGLEPRQEGSVVCKWDFPDLDTALHAILSAGPITRVIQQAGDERVREVVTEAIEPFRDTSGGYHLENEFIYLISRA